MTYIECRMELDILVNDYQRATHSGINRRNIFHHIRSYWKLKIVDTFTGATDDSLFPSN